MRRSLFHRLAAGLLALILILGSAAMPVRAEEAPGVTIKLHYNRPDGNYADWSVWFWFRAVPLPIRIQIPERPACRSCPLPHCWPWVLRRS